MIIRNLDGDELYKDSHITIRRTLEGAVSKGIVLSRADLRRANLSFALLDGMQADGACFWGSKLSGADLSEACLTNADFRGSCLKDACLASSDLSGSDFIGAFFKNTLLEGSKAGGTTFGGESLFDCDLSGVREISQAHYICQNGYKIQFLRSPIIIRGFSKCLVLIAGNILWGGRLYGVQGGNPMIPREVKMFFMRFMSKTPKVLSLRAGENKP